MDENGSIDVEVVRSDDRSTGRGRLLTAIVAAVVASVLSTLVTLTVVTNDDGNQQHVGSVGAAAPAPSGSGPPATAEGQGPRPATEPPGRPPTIPAEAQRSEIAQLAAGTAADKPWEVVAYESNGRLGIEARFDGGKRFGKMDYNVPASGMIDHGFTVVGDRMLILGAVAAQVATIRLNLAGSESIDVEPKRPSVAAKRGVAVFALDLPSGRGLVSVEALDSVGQVLEKSEPHGRK
jgi:hypothetical protein